MGRRTIAAHAWVILSKVTLRLCGLARTTSEVGSRKDAKPPRISLV